MADALCLLPACVSACRRYTLRSKLTAYISFIPKSRKVSTNSKQYLLIECQYWTDNTNCARIVWFFAMQKYIKYNQTTIPNVKYFAMLCRKAIRPLIKTRTFNSQSVHYILSYTHLLSLVSSADVFWTHGGVSWLRQMSKRTVEKTEKAKAKDITRSNDIFVLILLWIFSVGVNLHYIHF